MKNELQFFVKLFRKSPEAKKLCKFLYENLYEFKGHRKQNFRYRKSCHHKTENKLMNRKMKKKIK